MSNDRLTTNARGKDLDFSPQFPTAEAAGLNLTWAGVLYILAGLSQTPWAYFGWKFRTEALEFAQVPVFGWMTCFIALTMVWYIPQMVWVGTRIIQLSREKGTRLMQTSRQVRRMRFAAILLGLCVAVDILIFTGLPKETLDDPVRMVLLFGLLGTRTAAVNLIAVEAYRDKQRF